MDMTRLSGYGAPERAVELWRACQGERLLPLQARAVTECGLFGGESLLVQAPTSSGKTFIGEMAAVHAAMNRQKAVYLAPLKALAAEKYALFQDRYAALGLRVIVSSRDHRAHDRDFTAGRFDLAVAVYEKFAQLLAARPERLNEIGVVVADEMDLLSDPERGAGVEVLLTRLLAAGRRLVGLSAVLGGPERVAEWAGARLLREDRRPVDLRYGVLHGGVYRYRTHNDRTEGEERLAGAGDGAAWEAVAENARALAESGETCLVFAKSRHEARRGAELLADTARLPAAAAAEEALRALEPTRCRDALRRTLACGVAFHSTDLTPAERRAAEGAFRSGEARIMVSTATLAVGMNLPAANVFLSADKWVQDPRFDQPWRAPVGFGEYENMSGRAGRYGAGSAFGRSLLVAASDFDHESLWRCYVQGWREPLSPPLAQVPLADHVLQLTASRACAGLAPLVEFFGRTLAARLAWQSAGDTARRVRGAVAECVRAGALAVSGGGDCDPDSTLEATPFGGVAAAKGVSLATAAALRRWIGDAAARDWPDQDFLLAAALTPDGRMRHLSLSVREHAHGDYPARLGRALPQGCRPGGPRLSNPRLVLSCDEVRAVKAVLMLGEWLDEASLAAIEEAFDTTAGQLHAAAEQAAWLTDAAAGLAGALEAPPALAERLGELAERLGRGLRSETLPLARAAGADTERAAVLALARAGLSTREAVATAPPGMLERLAPLETARALRRWAKAPDTAGAPEAAPVLVVDDRRPGEIQIGGRAVALQEKQFLLIRALAARPGECVPYGELYGEVWGETVVEDNQMHFQKTALLRRVAAAAPEWARLVRTVPRRGFMLDLSPAQVARAPLTGAA